MINQVNIFMIGTGSVGKAFLNQISCKNTYYIQKQPIKLKITGIANRTKMLIEKRGIEPAKWGSKLNNQGSMTNIKRFIESMKRIDLSNSVFIDCTSENEIVPFYYDILKSMAIVTPNKSANSGSYKQYITLNKIAKKYRTGFRYSANVGVGLPSLDIISSLISGGDKIIAIEGLFSSTMNYLLDKLITTDKQFSELLRDAHINGLTEPDPRNDLNGIDTARKLLILVREAGVEIEMPDIKIENLVPEILRNINSLEKFYQSMKICNRIFEELKKKAINKKCRPLYSAKLKNGRASVGIETVDSSHPFFTSSADEKVVLFYTEFYKKHPLIIKGQSGGAKATAEVLVYDILKTIKK